MSAISMTSPVLAPRMEKPVLLRLAQALNSRSNALRRDECGDWCIRGRYGHIYAVPMKGAPNGEGFQLVIGTKVERSAYQWACDKRAMRSFATLSNDGDVDGAFTLNRLPTPDEAKTIRKVLRTPKRRKLSEVSRQALIYAGVQARRQAKKQPSDDLPAT